jgi:hypothetical protein
MRAADPTRARWPDVVGGRGHYESFYLRAVDPARPRGVWIRYTVEVRPSGRPTGQLWFTWFDRDEPAPRAVRVSAGEPDTGADAWIRMADAAFGPATVAGGVRTPERSATWTLRHTGDEPPLRHLARSWMYTARLPRTKLLSPAPSTCFDGILEVDGETIELAGWPGMIGHNWGEQHAEEWIWLSGLSFDGAGPTTWLDVAVGRVRLGPLTTPWIANGAISIDGQRRPLGGPVRRVGVTAAEDGCMLRLTGPAVVVTASASAPDEAFAAWDYASPDGSQHRVRNCSVADLSVRVDRPGRPALELTAPARAAYEWGRR